MSQENVELLHRAFDAFNRRDLDAFLSLCDPHVEFISYLARVEGGEPYRGYDGVRSWWERLLAVYSDFRADIEEVRDLGDRTILRARVHAHGVESDAPMDQTMWQVAEYHHGRTIGWCYFSSEAEALEAAGLSEEAMSQENVETVRRVFEIGEESLGREDDFGAVFDEWVRDGLMASDVAWRLGIRGGAGAAGIGDFAGREGFVAFMRTWTEDFDDFAIEAEEFIDAGNDRVVVIAVQHGIGRGSRAPVEMRYGYIFHTLEGRRIVQVEVFADPTRALQKAGLRE
jgi:ketosteroid isomerase-like protein